MLYNLYVISGINRSGVTTIGRFCVPYFISYTGIKLVKNVKNKIFTKLPLVIEIDDDTFIEGLKNKINTELLRNNILLIGHNIPQTILPVIPKYHIHLVTATNATQLYKFCLQEICDSDIDEIIENYHLGVSKSYITHTVNVYKTSKRRKITSIVSEIMDIFSFNDVSMNFLYHINSKSYHKLLENNYFYLSKIEINDYLPINSTICLISNYGMLELQIIDMQISLPCSNKDITIYQVKPLYFGPDKVTKYRCNMSNEYYFWDDDNKHTDLALLKFEIVE